MYQDFCDDWDTQYGSKLDARRRAAISWWIRQNQGIALSHDDGARLTTMPTPTVRARAERLLQEIERRQEDMAIPVRIGGGDKAQLELMGLTASVSYRELVYILRAYLVGQGFVTAHDNADGTFDVFITHVGYANLDQLRLSKGEGRIGFCAMWFDSSMTTVWDKAMEPAIREAGYEPSRIDRVQHNNKIDDEIIAAIRRSRFVIADFTGQRGGVYFEAGFALALGLQVIWTVKEDALDDVHFDTRQYNFIVWDRGDLQAFQAALRNRIEATIGPGPLAK